MTISIDAAPASSEGDPPRLERTLRVVDRHPVLVVVGLAAAARVVFALVSFLVNPTTLIPDEGLYLDATRWVAGGGSAEEWYPGYGQSLYDSYRVFLAPITFLFDALTPSRLLAQLWVATFGVLTAGLTTAIALHGQRPRWAAVAGAVVALLPSQVLWSSVVLREAPIWAMLALLGVAVPLSLRRDRRGPLLALLLAVVALWALCYLRQQTALIAAVALLITALVVGRRDRAARFTAAVLLAVLVPWLGGLGPAGYDFIQSRRGLSYERLNLSVNAESAFVARSTVVPPTVPSDVGGADPATAGAGGPDEPGQPGTAGPAASTSTTAMDATTTTTTLPEGVVVDQTGAAYEGESSIGADIRHLPRGTVAVLFRPWPHERSASVTLRLAGIENLAWYVLYALAILALPLAWRRRDVYAYPVVVGGGTLLAAALTQGNLGTAFRHRGQVLWALALLAALGAERLVDRRKRRSADRATSAGR